MPRTRKWHLLHISLVVAVLGAALGTAYAHAAQDCRSSCAPGFYHTGSQCLECPAGSFCAGACSAPVPCPIGTSNSLTGQALGSNCTKCPPGTFTNAPGSVSCSLCPAGYACPNAETRPMPCSLGQYSPAGSAQCLPCPDGYECPAPDVQPKACPVGEYSPAGSALCRPCPAGFSCAAADELEGQNGTTKPVACPPGTFSPLGAKDCTTCPAGHYCPVASAQPLACPPAYFSVAGSFQCEACPSGYACPNSGMIAPIACPAGTFSPAGSFECSACPVGHYCTAKSTQPKACPRGFVDAAPHSIGHRGAITTACQPCPSGMTSAESGIREKCVPCPAGHFCENDYAAVQQLVKRVTKDEAAGVITSDAVLDKFLAPKKCPSGSFCTEGSASPMLCPSGTFSSGTGATSASSCKPCPEGTYSANPGSSSCSKCGRHAFSRRGSTSCQCVGKHRTYLPKDGSCRCMAGYAPAASSVDGQAPSRYTLDGKSDCEPIELPICQPDEVRAATGECVNPANPLICDKSCGHVRVDIALDDDVVVSEDVLRIARAKARGYFDAELGICICASPTNEEVCSSLDCQNLPRLSISREASSDVPILNVLDPKTGALHSTPVTSLPGFYGPSFRCNNPTDCTIVSIEATSRGHRAILGVPEWIANATGAALMATPSKTPKVDASREDEYTLLSSGRRIRAMSSSAKLAEKLANSNSVDRRTHKVVQLLVSDEDLKFAGSSALPFGSSQTTSDSASIAASSSMMSSLQSTFSSLAPQVEGAKKWAMSKLQFTYDDAQAADAQAAGTGSVASSSSFATQAVITYDPSLADTYTGILYATVCLVLGEGVIWNINGQHHPVYESTHALNTNPSFDYSDFTDLTDRLINQQENIAVFGFSFNQPGTYVFSDYANPYTLTIFKVLDEGLTCPTTTTGTYSTSLASLGIVNSYNVAVTPDLTPVYMLIGVFVGVSILLAIFAKLMQYQARRAMMVQEHVDETLIQKGFARLNSLLERQSKEHKHLFEDQLERFRRECDRVAAETGQIKALLTIKVTEDAGSLRAAKNLLMAENTARLAYNHTQQMHEQRVLNLLTKLAQEIQEDLVTPVQLGPNSPLPRANEQVTFYGQELSKLIDDLIAHARKERERRELLANNPGLISRDLMNLIDDRNDSIDQYQLEIDTLLEQFKTQYLDPNIQAIIQLDMQFSAREADLRKQRNQAVVDNVKTRFKLQLDNYERKILEPIIEESGDEERFSLALRKMEDIFSRISNERANAERDGEEALLRLRKQIAEATNKQKHAIFKGIPPDLEKAMRLFLCQAGSAIMPDDVHFGTVGLPQEGKTAVNADEIIDIDPLRDLLVSDIQDAATDKTFTTPAQLSGNIDEDVETILSRLNDSTLTPDDIKSLYANFLKKQDLMERLLAEQRDRTIEQAQELLQMEAKDQEDRERLEAATEQLKALIDQHEQEKRELSARLAAEQQAAMEREIEAQARQAELDEIKYQEERRRLEAELEAKRKNLVADSPEDTAAIAEHILKLKQLDEAKRQDSNKYQQALKDKHAEWKMKRQREMDALRMRQQNELKEKEKAYSDTVSEIRKKEEEEKKTIGGVDIAALAQIVQQVGAEGPARRATGDAAGGDDDDEFTLEDDEEIRQEKKKFLEDLAAQKRSELQREHEEAKRRLEAELERERQQQLQAFEAEARRRKEEALARLEEQQRAASGGADPSKPKDDTEEGRRIWEAYLRDKADLERQMDADANAQRAKLEQALRAKQALRQKNLFKQQEKDRLKAEQEQKKLEESLRLKAQQQKEEELLKTVIESNHLDASNGAKEVVESVLAERHKLQFANLMKEQREEAARTTKEMLDQAYADFFSKKERLCRLRDEGEIDEDEAKRQLDDLEKSVDEEALRRKIEAEIKAKHEAELKAARDQANAEIREMLTKLIGPGAGDVARWEDKKELQRRLEEAEARKRQEEQELIEKQKKLEEDLERMRQEYELQAHEQLEAEMAQQEERLRREREEREREFAKRQEQQRQEHERLLAERERKAREEANESKDKESAEQIMKQFNEEKQQLLEMADIEAKRQMERYQLALAQRQEAQRKRAKELANKKIREQLEKDEAYRRKLQEEEELKRQQAARQQAMQIANRNLAFKLVKAGKIVAQLRQQGINDAVALLKKAYQEQREKILAQLRGAAAGAGATPAGKSSAPVAGPLNVAALQSLPEAVKQSILASLPDGGADLTAALSAAAAPGGLGDGTTDAFVHKVDRVEKLLRKLCRSNVPEVAALPHGTSSVYVDPADEAIVPSSTISKPIALQPTSMNARQFLVYRFGGYIVDFCANSLKVPSFSLLIASQLPVKKFGYRFEDNMFKNSFHYDAPSRTIFIHESRLTHVGRLALILAHVVAHIVANEWYDDSPAFQKNFYFLLSGLLAELFFARSFSSDAAGSSNTANSADIDSQLVAATLKTANAAFPLVASSWASELGAAPLNRSHSKTPWETVEKHWEALEATLKKDRALRESLAPGTQLQLKEDIIGDFLDIATDQDDFFANEELYERLDQYRAFREYAPLKRELALIEENVRKNMAVHDAQHEANAQPDIKAPELDQDDVIALAAHLGVALSGKSEDAAVHFARLERLRLQADKVNIEIVALVTKMQAVSATLLEEEAKYASLVASVAGTNTPPPQLPPAVVQMREMIKRMGHTKTVLVSKLRALEERIHGLVMLTKSGDSK